MKPLCIYHGNCADGFAAAWVVRRALATENAALRADLQTATDQYFSADQAALKLAEELAALRAENETLKADAAHTEKWLAQFDLVPKMDQRTWQPIETAPKDGTNILVTVHDQGDPKKPRHMAVVEWDKVEQEWTRCSGHPYFTIWPPTHWQPLPAFPDNSRAEG